jgi:hypothetical protein
MKCGPGRRCLLDAPKEKMIVNKIKAQKQLFLSFIYTYFELEI